MVEAEAIKRTTYHEPCDLTDQRELAVINGNVRNTHLAVPSLVKPVLEIIVNPQSHITAIMKSGNYRDCRIGKMEGKHLQRANTDRADGAGLLWFFI